MTFDKITASLSQAFLDKVCIHPGSEAERLTQFATSFHSITLPVQGFVEHILSGKAWTPGVFRGNYRKTENWETSCLLALDLDNGVSVQQALTDPAIKGYALLVHPSPSSTPEHPKTRVIFRLSEFVHKASAWEVLQRALLARFADLKPDMSAKDAARFYYGSTISKAHINLNAILPISAIAKYTIYEAERDYLLATRKDAPSIAPVNEGLAARYAAGALNNALAQIATAPDKTRNNTLNEVAFVLFGYAKANDWPGITEAIVEARARECALRAGLGEHEIETTLRSARSSAQAVSIQPALDKLRTSSAPNGQRAPSTPVADPQFIDVNDAARAFRDSLIIEHAPARPPLPNPVAALHEFGGMCRIVPPGKVWGIMSASGMGKTSFVESLICDVWGEQGWNGILIPGEWTPEEVVMRYIQRQGGPNMTRILEHRLWQWEGKQRQIARRGTLLSAAEDDAVHRAIDRRLTQRGKLYLLPYSQLSVVQLVDEVRKFVLSAPVDIHYVVLDYFTMYSYNLTRQIMSTMQQLWYIKNQWSPAKDFPGLVIVPVFQVTKGAGKDSRARDSILDAADAMEIREDPINLFISLKPELLKDEAGNVLGHADSGTIRVHKNSLGRAFVNRCIGFDPMRLRWIDRIVSDKLIAEERTA